MMLTAGVARGRAHSPTRVWHNYFAMAYILTVVTGWVYTSYIAANCDNDIVKVFRHSGFDNDGHKTKDSECIIQRCREFVDFLKVRRWLFTFSLLWPSRYRPPLLDFARRWTPMHFE